MGIADKLSKVVNGLLSNINESNIYEWVMKDQDQTNAVLDPIVKKAKVEYNLYLAGMTPSEKQTWELCHQKGRKMACEALKNYLNFDQKKAFEYFSLNNSPEINHEVFVKDAQNHDKIFNQIREYFQNEPYDRMRVLVLGRMEMETFTLNRYWKIAREKVLVENQRMKAILKMAPEELVILNFKEFHNISFNGEDVIRFRKLNEKYYNDPVVNKHVERIKEIVLETEQLSKQLENKWREERDQRGLIVMEGRNTRDYEDYER